MQQIADWLGKLGMPEYAQRFAENGIDVSVLRYLTDQDLEKIGVLLGHRRKMLAAIAELVGAVQAPPQRALTESKPQDTAERRQVTVMFSDLVGSTALSARMDPEDLREVISTYQRCVAETVQRLGGFVAKYMGDGVLVHFGSISWEIHTGMFGARSAKIFLIRNSCSGARYECIRTTAIDSISPSATSASARARTA
jgi:hypothetical protein